MPALGATRRPLVAILALCAAAVVLIGCSSSSDQPTEPGPTAKSQQPLAPPGSDRGEGIATAPPRPAMEFVDSVGVNLHTYYEGTPYPNFAMIAQRLGELGIHHIRDNLVTDEPGEYEYLNGLAARGIKSTLIMGGPENGISGLDELVGTLRSELVGAVDAVEGPNELDISHYRDWPAQLTKYQSALYERMKGDPSLASIPVVGPSLAYLRHAPAAPDLSRYLDYGNIHSYSGGEPPEPVLQEWLAGARFMSGDKPVMSTETGYHTAINSDGDHPPVSEEAEATYLPRLFLDYFANGVSRTFPYELIDEHPDPELDEPESDFGLLRNDYSPKPAFTALRNLLTILDDPGGSSFTPRPFEYTLSGNRTDLRQLVLAKSDGSYWLALWRAGSVWDTATREPIEPGSAPVDVRFGRAPGTATEYQPNVSDRPTATLPVDRGEVRVRVGARVVILALAPAQ